MTSHLYIGANTDEAQSGLLHTRFDSTTGMFTPARRVLPTASIMFLALSPDRRFLYAVSTDMLDDGQKVGGLLAFEIDPASGDLRALGTSPMGGVLCHLSVDATGKWLLTAAYTDGNVAVWPLGTDGTIGPRATLVQHEGQGGDPKRQSAPHAHQIILSPDNSQAFAADLGLDKVLIYDFDRNSGALTPATPPFAQTAPCAGPRHAAFHPHAGFLYVVNELDNTVTVFARQDGEWNAVQAISTLPEGYDQPTWCAEIAVTADGRFVYATNRGHHSVAAYAIGDNGWLTLTAIVPTGAFPQHLTLDPTGNWLLVAARDAQSVEAYRIDPQTGVPAASDELPGLPGGPMCLQFG